MFQENFIEFSGKELVTIRPIFEHAKNSFTYEFWVKPEGLQHLDKPSVRGTSGTSGKRYVIGPGNTGKKEEAGVGISVGSNGVAVYEHAENYMPAVLVHEVNITEWIHVAVVYNNRRPNLYIDGNFICTGLLSPMKNVYASGFFGGYDPYGFYIGKMAEVRIWTYARTQEEIQESMKNKLHGREDGLFGYWKFDKDEKSILDRSKNNNHGLLKMANQRKAIDILAGSMVNGKGVLRNLLESAEYAQKQSQTKAILFINHSLGGGTQYYQENHIESIKGQNRVYILKLKGKKIILRDLRKGSGNTYTFILSKFNHAIFQCLLRLFKINLIYIDQLVTFPTYRFIEFIRNSGVDYIFDIHDFYCVCPSYKLLNFNGLYCNAETDMNICQRCISRKYPREGISIKIWRDRFHSLLSNASGIICPSNDTKKLILRYYPNLNVTVKDRAVPSTIRYTFDPVFLKEKELSIAFIGNISKPKGSEVIYRLLESIREKKLPVKLKVFGTTHIHGKYYQSPDRKLEVMGRYNNKQISSILRKYKISIVIIPAIWPETFSWTTSEAMWSGYPVITFNIGAPAERVKKYDGGWVLDGMDSGSIFQLLQKLESSRGDILKKARNLKGFTS